MTPTPTETPTQTPTETPTNTPSETATMTPTPSETPTQTPTNTVTPTNTETPTNTPTPTSTPTESVTPTPSVTITNTPTMTMTPSPTSPMVTTGDWYLTGNEGLYTGGPGSGATTNGDGNAFFTYGTGISGLTTSYNPNLNSNTYVVLRFNTKNNAGVDYFSLFQSIQNNGGTMSITQNGDTAIFTLPSGLMYINDFTSHRTFSIDFSPQITQTQNSTNPFVFGSPITITFRG
jgi:hypothetical protein